jgi:hypothetical protein
MMITALPALSLGVTTGSSRTMCTRLRLTAVNPSLPSPTLRGGVVALLVDAVVVVDPAGLVLRIGSW